jgi:DNA-binding LacI/PurR family transcriptional regulator
MLLERIRGIREQPERVSIVPELIIRESTLPPNLERLKKK